MSRVLALFTIAIAVAGCSLSQQSAITSLNDQGASPQRATTARQTALGGDPTESRSRSSGNSRRLASLDDRAPSGSYDKAPRGSLSDRDYSLTRLDSETARDAINAYRKSKGLKPLSLDATLTAAAKAHSRDLAKWDRISHFGSDGSNPWDRVKRTGYNARLAAENVGTGQISFDEVLKGWEKSPGHNKNLMLRDATHMGIALVHEPKTEFKTFWTLVIGAPL